jgi:hypothetical protein
MKWVTRGLVARLSRGCKLGAVFAGVIIPCGLLNNELANGATRPGPLYQCVRVSYGVQQDLLRGSVGTTS